jgi:hypothetical protein
MRVLDKVFVSQFYRENANLFFLIIAFAGGFMRSHDHLALGEFLVASPSLLSIPITVWLSYTAFIMNYNREMAARDVNGFLYHFILIRNPEQASSCMRVSFFQLFPAILHGIFLIGLAAKAELIIQVSMIVVALLLILAMNCFHLTRLLRRSFNFGLSFGSAPWLLLPRITRPFNIIVLRGTFSRQAISFLGYKTVGLLLLWSALFLSNSGDYDLRLISLAATISFSLNISFIYECHDFENRHFVLFRAMPFNLIRRLCYALITLIIYLLPELMLLIRNWPIDFGIFDLTQVILYGVSICLLWYCFLFTKDRKLETIISYVSIISISYFLLVLAALPLAILCLANFSLATFFYTFFYYRFEFRGSGDDIKN